MMNLQSYPVNGLLFVGFNQDYSHFACGTENGFRVYKTDPFSLLHRRDFRDGSGFGEDDGGIGVACMLLRTNLLALVGGGAKPRYPSHDVILWDDRKDRAIANFSFGSPVKSVRLRKDVIAAVLDNHIYVYGWTRLNLLDSIETTNNPKGLCCLSPEGRIKVVCPGMQRGHVQVIVYLRSDPNFPALLQRERTEDIAAHDSNIAAMATDYSAALLATASEKGTIVRVFDTARGAKLHEVRRGAERAEIHSLAFSPQGDWLVVASDKGTIHVFTVNNSLSRSYDEAPPSFCSADSSQPAGSFCTANGARPNNSRTSWHRLAHVLPNYFQSEWSLAQFRVPDYRCIAAFGSEPHTVIVICGSGAYYKARFDPRRGGEMIREELSELDNAPTASPSGSFSLSKEAAQAARPRSADPDELTAHLAACSSADSNPPRQSGREHG